MKGIEMVINKNSWHYRLIHKVDPTAFMYGTGPRDICSYFGKLLAVFALMLLVVFFVGMLIFSIVMLVL